jgi:hypothetical protein
VSKHGGVGMLVTRAVRCCATSTYFVGFECNYVVSDEYCYNLVADLWEEAISDECRTNTEADN